MSRQDVTDILQIVTTISIVSIYFYLRHVIKLLDQLHGQFIPQNDGEWGIRGLLVEIVAELKSRR